MNKRFLKRGYIALFALISLAGKSTVLAADVPREKQGLYAGAGASYHLMTAEFYSRGKEVSNAPALTGEIGYKFGGGLRTGFRFWIAQHSIDDDPFTASSFLHRGFEICGKFVLARKTRLRPYVLLGYGGVSFKDSGGDGYRGFGYSFAAGLEYWFNEKFTICSEFDFHYLEYNGIQVGGSRNSLGVTNGSMLGLDLLKLHWHF
jgi:opacity protein-like surface antigen